MQFESDADTGPPAPEALTINSTGTSAAAVAQPRGPLIRGLTIAILSLVSLGPLLGCDKGPDGYKGGPGGVFAQAKRGEEDLDAMGERLKARKEELMASMGGQSLS